jgi:biopolymer transport protein ExbD
MSIRFQCPNCKAVRAASERLLGREIRCPECDHAVQLPTPEELAAQRQRRREAAEAEEQTARANAARLAAAAAANRTTAQPALESPEELEEPVAFRRPGSSSADDMDMTPMVDVTFLLLIFFMVTASFSIQKTIQRPAKRLDAPSRQVVPKEEDANVVTVQVDEFNAYSILSADGDETASSKQDLIIALNRAREGGRSGVKPNKVLIQAHTDCMHGAVIAALDAGREALFENFEVTTVEQFD